MEDDASDEEDAPPAPDEDAPTVLAAIEAAADEAADPASDAAAATAAVTTGLLLPLLALPPILKAQMCKGPVPQ